MSVDPRLRNACTVHPLHRAAIIGEAPGPNTRGDFPMYPYPPRSAAGRLKDIIGFTTREYLLSFARANLLDTYPGKAFPVKLGRQAVDGVIERMRGKPLLLMGRGVANAFGAGALEVLTWCEIEPGVRVAVIPHPSGRNVWYNDEANRAAVRAFFVPFRAGEDQPREDET